jgi:hypothetical protein
MHDGAQAHFSHAVRDVNTYHNGQTGKGPTAWPSRSPGLNLLDFYLWGHVHILVYAALVDNEEVPVRLSATTPVSLNGCGGP